MQDYDVIVLGTGAAGSTAAIMAADGGARVAVFEKADNVGGTSAWRSCTQARGQERRFWVCERQTGA